MRWTRRRFLGGSVAAACVGCSAEPTASPSSSTSPTGSTGSSSRADDADGSVLDGLPPPGGAVEVAPLTEHRAATVPTYPERIVVEHNLNRAESTGKLDVAYLSSLSLDVAPAVFARLDSIDAVDDDPSRDGLGPIDAQTRMRIVWCAKVAAADDGDGLSFNVARASAATAASEPCS